MKKMKLINFRHILGVAVLCLLMSGCVSRRIAWSPDGAHAAIFAEEGLHLCSPDGALSEMILPGVELAEWFPDSQRLAVTSEVGKQSWTDLEKVISPEECERIVQGGQKVREERKAGHSFAYAFNALTNLGDNEKNAVSAYLAESEGTKEQVGANWDVLPQKVASLFQMRVGTLDRGRVMFGPPLINTLRKIVDIRISPGGTAIACTAEGDKKDELQLLLIAANGSTPPQVVAKNTAYCSDWSRDGRSLLYIHAEDADGDAVDLGSLTRRTVLNSEGRLEIQTNTDDLAGLIFDANNKVRCLSDGRIIFAAADIHLPCTVADIPQQPQLFALDPERVATVIPLIPRSVQDSLPPKLNYYETSPDGKRIALSADKGPVLVLTVATGELETVQKAGENDMGSAPAWRSSSELCYIFRTNGQPAQVALWNNGTNRVLSANWPADVRKGFLDK
jgi:hypothetical protein